MLLALGIGGVAWAAAIDLSGGIVLNTGWGRISSRNPLNPFAIGAAPAVEYLRARGHDVYVVEDDGDVEGFTRRFANTNTVRDLARTLPATLGGVRVYAVGGSSPVVAPPVVW